MGMATRAKQFPQLETLRGVAALAVLWLHTQTIVDRAHGRIHGSLTHGYLAVDFFFMLSGFVISSAYADRLRNGWPGQLFMAQRMRRLYPTYAAALVLASLVYVLTAYAHGGPMTAWDTGILTFALVMSALFFPLLSSGHTGAFPLDGPAWSLSHEVLANVVFASSRRYSDRVLGLAAALGGLGCVYLVRRDHALQAGAM